MREKGARKGVACDTKQWWGEERGERERGEERERRQSATAHYITNPLQTHN
jgi:hypothetical protein